MSTLSSTQPSSQQNGEIDFLNLLSQLRENLWLILFMVFFTVSLSAFFASRKIPEYQSEILLQIKSNSSGNSGGVGKILSQLNYSNGGGDAVETTQIALITSPYILVPVVKSLGLDINAVPQQSTWSRLFSPSRAQIDVKQFDVPVPDTNKQFILVYTKVNKYSLYNSMKNLLLRGEVGKLAESHDKSIRLLIENVSAPNNTTFFLKKMQSSMVAKSLKEKLAVKDLGSNKQQTGVIALTLANPIPEKAVLILNAIGRTIQAKDVKSNAIEASKTLEFLYQQLPITQKDLEKSETALNQYRAKSGKIDIKLQSNYLLSKLTRFDRELSALNVDKIDKLQQYTAKHPLIIALNIKINELRIERQKLELQLTKLPASDQIAVNLMRDVKVKDSLYTLLLKKIQELQVVKAGIVSNVRILSLATLPMEPLPMNRSIVIFAGFIFGLLLSFLIIFARKLMFARVDDPHWGERNLGLVNLAIVPYSKEQYSIVANEKGRSLSSSPLLAHVNSRNLAIESLRSLRTSLQIRLSCEPNNIVSIMGVSPGVGKTFVTANLAYLLAAAGKRVVMIDTDMRRGTLHKYFNVQPSPGLAEVLNANHTMEDALQVTAVHENLVILPRGIYPHDPSELLTSERFKEVVNTLSKQFDVVVIDTPPLLLVTDAVLISVHAGTNYLVLGANAHQPSQIEISIKHLTNAGVSLNGSIYNFHKQAKAGHSGYYKYGYNYNYYSDQEVSK